MVTRYDAALDGVLLSSLSSSIYVLDVQEKDPKMLLETYRLAKGDGLFVDRKSRDSLSVTVKFAIREYDPVKRQTVMEKVSKWCRGSVLTLPTRPNKRLVVSVDTLPVLPSQLKWTDAITVTFTARDVPYWESTSVTKASAMEGMLGETRFTVPATVETPLLFSVTNVGDGEMTLFSIEAEGKKMSFNGMSLAPNERFTVTQKGGVVVAPVEFLTDDSVDVILLPPGEPTHISYVANQNAKVEITARGRYL